MIFPKVTTKQWLKMYPDLEVETDFCDYCDTELVTEIPILQTDWVGLTSPKCSCGETQLFTKTPRNAKSAFLLYSYLN